MDKITEESPQDLAARAIACLENPNLLEKASIAAVDHARRKFSLARMNARLMELYAN